ncbi:MAG TPA: tRNA pseudouridine(38-40) synthase TruA [bacterium]|nr:tRNA pseudouridine(38-40) synthase TruA [bacterium]HPQ67185.1 tRNA pseudouridine(38-40) synthase TruA [bacterium]
MKRIRLLLEYDGTPFSGWQIQPGRDTVQERLETALAEVLGEKVRVHGAGRTDAGVHAWGQVAHFDTRSDLPPPAIRAGCNRILPAAVAVLAAEAAPEGFHSRYHALGKRYRYLILIGRPISPLRRSRAWLRPAALDAGAMRKASRPLLGKHDFTAFAGAGRPLRNGIRTLSRLDVEEDGELLAVEIEGSGFLYRMVRNIVGTLAEVGRGKMPASRVEEILRSRERTQAGPTAPPNGLYLVSVSYPFPVFGEKMICPSRSDLLTFPLDSAREC